MARRPPRNLPEGTFFPFETIFRLLTEVNWFVSSRLLRTRRRARLRTPMKLSMTTALVAALCIGQFFSGDLIWGHILTYDI